MTIYKVASTQPVASKKLEAFKWDLPLFNASQVKIWVTKSPVISHLFYMFGRRLHSYLCYLFTEVPTRAGTRNQLRRSARLDLHGFFYYENRGMAVNFESKNTKTNLSPLCNVSEIRVELHGDEVRHDVINAIYVAAVVHLEHFALRPHRSSHTILTTTPILPSSSTIMQLLQQRQQRQPKDAEVKEALREFIKVRRLAVIPITVLT